MSSKSIEVYGVPWDEKSSFMRGCRDAPNKIWDAFNCESANRCSESGINLAKSEVLRFQGSMPLTSGNAVLTENRDCRSGNRCRRQAPHLPGR